MLEINVIQYILVFKHIDKINSAKTFHLKRSNLLMTRPTLY